MPAPDFKVATKVQASPSTIRHLLLLKGQGVEVFQQTYIMSCQGKVDMTRWGGATSMVGDHRFGTAKDHGGVTV